MVLATCGTFDYMLVVPDGSFGGKRQMQGMLRKPIEGDQERLMGHAPLLQTVEYCREKWHLLGRITLTATSGAFPGRTNACRLSGSRSVRTRRPTIRRS